MKSVSGLYVMFLLFVLVLRKIRNINRVEYHPQKQRFTPEMREAIRRMEQYSEQTRLLCRHKIETPEQQESLQSERDDLSKQIVAVRKELAIAIAAQKSTDEIRRKLQTQRELEKQRLEAEKSKQQNKNKERGYSR